MKRFLTQLTLFTLLLLGLNQLPFLLNPYFGNPHYSAKHAWYRERAHRYNAVLMGSSRIQSQVNPAVLDQELKPLSISTFNLASHGAFNPEVYHLTRNLIAQTPPGRLDYIFLELLPLDEFAGAPPETPKSYYWQTPYNTQLALQQINHSNHPPPKKRALSIAYLRALLYRAANPNGLYTLLHGNSQSTRHTLGPDQNGYDALDRLMRDQEPNNAYAKRRQVFLDHQHLFPRKVQTIKQWCAQTNHDKWLNQRHLTEALDLIASARARDIHLVFIVPPLHDQTPELLAVAQHLPLSNVVILADPAIFPDLYKTHHLFDGDHLNSRGADRFSACLAQALRHKLTRP